MVTNIQQVAEQQRQRLEAQKQRLDQNPIILSNGTSYSGNVEGAEPTIIGPDASTSGKKQNEN